MSRGGWADKARRKDNEIAKNFIVSTLTDGEGMMSEWLLEEKHISQSYFNICKKSVTNCDTCLQFTVTHHQLLIVSWDVSQFDRLAVQNFNLFLQKYQEQMSDIQFESLKL